MYNLAHEDVDFMFTIEFRNILIDLILCDTCIRVIRFS